MQPNSRTRPFPGRGTYKRDEARPASPMDNMICQGRPRRLTRYSPQRFLLCSMSVIEIGEYSPGGWGIQASETSWIHFPVGISRREFTTGPAEKPSLAADAVWVSHVLLRLHSGCESISCLAANLSPSSTPSRLFCDT